ncbi:MAG: trigger factor [Chitinophagales bacterium]|nr:trigger factor [Chitinophagales bacterium]MCZ2393487.1 trigger factor [Chitinophagales bacterium]
MNITRKDSDALNAILSVNLTKEDYLPKVEQALNKLKKNVSLKGFRPGMVPAALVKKMYGTGVLVDELNKIVNDTVNNYIQDNKVEILGRPLPVPTDIQFDINQLEDYTLEFELGVSPEFVISTLNSNTTIKAPKVNITDDLLDKELDNLRSKYGKMSFPEDNIQEKDILQVKFVELADNQEAKEGGVEASGPINLEIVNEEALKATLLEGKVGTVAATSDLFSALNREKAQVIKHVLGLESEPEGMSSAFELTIERISRMEKSDLNQEFFDKVFGPEQVKSEKEAKEKLRSELSAYVSQSENGKLNERIFTYLLDNTEISLPDAFLKKWIMASNEKPLSEEELEAEYPAFARNLKWSLIVNKISKDNDLKGDFEEVKEYSKEALRQQLRQYSPTGEGFSDDDLEMLNNSMLAKEDHVKKSFDAVMEQKLFTVIKQQLTIEDEVVSFEDFFKS